MRGYRLLTIATALVTAVAAFAETQTVAAADVAGLASQPTTGYARVIRPYGAAVRVAPDGDAANLYNAACNETFPIVGRSGDWYEVYPGQSQLGAATGWVGGGRVRTGAYAYPSSVDCGGAPTFYAGQYVGTYVESGCLSLRAAPSRRAEILSCVDNHHLYQVDNGPFDPGTGEDWFQVGSRATGTGWVLARHLYPA